MGDTYGEVLPEGILKILWRLGAKPGDHFYDLGCGPGKMVALAWMLGLRATGVELSRARWEASCYALEGLSRLEDWTRHHPSDLAWPARVAGADLVYVHASILEGTSRTPTWSSSPQWSSPRSSWPA